MTENLLYKLEEKMMLLLSEIEDLRKDVQRLSNENTTLRFERETHSRKLQDLISLLDAVNTLETKITHTANIKPMILEEVAQAQN